MRKHNYKIILSSITYQWYYKLIQTTIFSTIQIEYWDHEVYNFVRRITFFGIALISTPACYNVSVLNPLVLQFLQLFSTTTCCQPNILRTEDLLTTVSYCTSSTYLSKYSMRHLPDIHSAQLVLSEANSRSPRTPSSPRTGQIMWAK